MPRNKGIPVAVIVLFCNPLLIGQEWWQRMSNADSAVLAHAAEMRGMSFESVENQPQQNQGTAQEAFKIKVNVALVSTDVTVTGTNVPELRPEDFTIQDDGVAQTLSHFSRGQFPLAVALLIDRSSSIEAYLPMLKISALSALRRLHPEDQVALFSFDNDLAKLSDLTNDRVTIVKEIHKIATRRGTTNLYDSIHDVARYLAENAANRRRAVILVSDNCHIDGKYDSESARDEILKASATLYGIKTSGDRCGWHNNQVAWIASETGGEIIDANTAISLQAALEKAISNLRLQYTLGFIPSDVGEDGSFHKLTINLTAEDRCPGCRVSARSGYYAGISAPFPSEKNDSVAPRQPVELTDQELVQLIMLTAGASALELTYIPFTIKARKQTDSNGQPQLELDIRIDFAGIGSIEEKDRRTCKLYLAVLYADAKGQILGAEWKTVRGVLSDESYDIAIRDGIPVSITIPIRDKKQIIKAVVYDERNDRMGSKTVRLD